MHISVVASDEHRNLVNDLLADIKNVTFSFVNDDTIPRTLVKRRLSLSNAIIVIVDEKLGENQQLVYVSKIASVIAKEDSQVVLLPIAIDGTKIPDFLADWLYFTCDMSSRRDIMRTRNNIRRVLSRQVEMQTKMQKNTNTVWIVVLTIAMAIFALILAVFFFIDSPFSINSVFYDDDTFVLLSVLATSSALLVLLISYFSVFKRQRVEDVNKEIELYSKRLKRAIIPEVLDDDSKQEADKKDVDAIGRMMINLEDIKEFYTWSQKQAKAAFYLAMWMCVAGFVLIVVAIVLPLIFKTGVQGSIIPALGGVITELLAGTALVVYKNSLSQLNHYHQALHEDERFLSSVNLVSKFHSIETQDLMLQEIIRSEIQMNLSNLNNNAVSGK